MRSNELEDPESTEHLLLWLSSAANSACTLRSLEQLEQSSAVSDLLKLIDPDFFPVTQPSELLDVGRCVTTLDQYLQTRLGKTVKTRHRKKLIQECNMGGLLGLLLYMCVHCQHRQRFISGILELPAESQRQLMHIIEHSDSCIENIMEIRQILDKVEQLQGENDELRAQLRQENTRSEELQERLAVALLDYRQLEEEFDMLKKQKTEVLRELNIQVFGEYLQLYRLLQAENVELLGNLQQYELRNMQLERDKSGFKAKIMDDGEIISNLNEQLQRVKGVCKTLRLSNSFSLLDTDRSEHGNAQLEFDYHVLKQNRMLTNLELSTSTSIGDRSKRNLYEQWTDTPLYLRMKHELDEAQERCTGLEELAETQRRVLEDFEQQSEQLSNENNWLHGQLTALRALHEDFQQVVYSESD